MEAPVNSTLEKPTHHGDKRIMVSPEKMENGNFHAEPPLIDNHMHNGVNDHYATTKSEKDEHEEPVCEYNSPPDIPVVHEECPSSQLGIPASNEPEVHLSSKPLSYADSVRKSSYGHSQMAQENHVNIRKYMDEAPKERNEVPQQNRGNFAKGGSGRGRPTFSEYRGRGGKSHYLLFLS